MTLNVPNCGVEHLGDEVVEIDPRELPRALILGRAEPIQNFNVYSNSAVLDDYINITSSKFASSSLMMQWESLAARQRPPRASRMKHVFSNAPIYDSIFRNLSPRTLVRLSRTCHMIHEAVTRFCQRAYNINRHLSRYFPDPLSFRSLQARTGLIISGSSALQFLDRSFYPESDLDIYCHPGHVYEVLEWMESFWYRFEPHKYQDASWRSQVSADWDGTVSRIRVLDPLHYLHEEDRVRSTRYSNIAEVYNFKRFMIIDEELVALQVQVIETINNPIDTIMKYHSSVFKLLFFYMNFNTLGHSLRHEHHYFRRGVFILPNRNI